MNSAPAVAALQATLALAPEQAHKVDSETQQADEDFFLGEAMRGNGRWYGKLMEDHTALDWRDSIKATFGPGSRKGPLKVVDFINGDASNKLAKSVVTDRGGHWCFWESADEFNETVLGFLDD
ncbi:hypothetical protein BLS_004622 [Venturia inaequalis]|uniref:Uncharacterized protein n=1 Tax=Venturia inaequalis TaxID=5025 RepID=A0A8H3YRY0_VENIN|nr:hypothetical protein BLS_004622 [Venturia inaequalis]